MSVPFETVYLSLGSNLGDRQAHLEAAIAALARDLDLLNRSALYETEPVGIRDQPPFLNLAVEARTELTPIALLKFVKGVEREVGRRPTYRWGPRVVDIDILLHGNRQIETSELVIPHREMPVRAFVLVPLVEIAPDVVHPGLGLTARQLLARTGGEESVRPYGQEP